MSDLTVYIFGSDFEFKQKLSKSLRAYGVNAVLTDDYQSLQINTKDIDAILLDISFDDEKTIDLGLLFPVLKVLKSYPDFKRIDFHDFIIYPFSDKELYCRIMNLYNVYKNIQYFDSINSDLNSYLLNLSHDVYSPIKLIKNQIQYLINLDVENSNEVLESVLGQLDNIVAVLSSVPYSSTPLDSSKIYENLVSVDVIKLLTDIVKQFSFYAKVQDIEFIYNSTIAKNEKPFITANYAYCWRMVYNILFNAIKYSLGGGDVRLSLFKNENNLKLIVADSGIGIAPEHLLYIRQYLMSQENDKNSRFGRGMAVIKLVADYLKATVNVDSELGIGTTFTVELSNVTWRLS